VPLKSSPRCRGPEMDQEAPEINDTCFLALTRPVMFMGVPMEAFGLNAVVSTMFYLLMGSIKYAAAGVVVHFVFREIVRRDHNMFRVLKAYLDTRGIQRNLALWGGSSVSPARLVPKYSEGDLDG
jgi:type IV secretion system protein VirB3